MTNNIGQRIRYLREKAGLSRSQFSMKFGISPSTLRSYESGDAPIPDIKITLFKNIFKEIGFELDRFPTKTEAIVGKENTPSISLNLNDINIKREVDFFKSTNLDFILYTVTNDHMYPIFNPGDILGGTKIQIKIFMKFSGAICIVIDTDNEKFIGRIIDVKKTASLFLHVTTLTHVLIHLPSKNALAIAQVTRHWCLNGMVRL
jgi:transcriptional regulator with XRE-family HTH domain